MKVGGPQNLGGGDEFLLFDHDHVVADHLAVAYPAGDGEHGDQVEYARAHHGHDGNGEDDVGEGQKYVAGAHDDLVRDAPGVPRDDAQHAARQDLQGDGRRRDQQGGRAADQQAGEHVAAQLVRAENVALPALGEPRRRQQALADGGRLGVIDHKGRGDEADEQDPQRKGQPHHKEWAAPHAAQKNLFVHAFAPPLLQCDTGIDQGIDDVHHQIDHREHGRDQKQRGLHQLVIPGADGLVDQLAQARPGEDGLHHHRPSQKDADLYAHQSDDRDQGVFEGVLPEDLAPAHALGVGRRDVVLLQYVDHAGAPDSGDLGRHGVAQGDGGEDHVLNTAVAHGGEPPQLRGEDIDEQNPQPHGGHGLPEDGEEHGQKIRDGPLPRPRHHPQGNADQKAHEDRPEGQRAGDGQAAGQNAGHGLLVDGGHAQIPGQHAGHVPEVLLV